MVHSSPDSCDVHCVHPDALAAARASPADRAEHLDGARALFAALGVTESAVSHQLRGLRALRLVASERDRKVVYHRLDDDHVAEADTEAPALVVQTTDLLACAVDAPTADGRPVAMGTRSTPIAFEVPCFDRVDR